MSRPLLFMVCWLGVLCAVTGCGSTSPKPAATTAPTPPAGVAAPATAAPVVAATMPANTPPPAPTTAQRQIDPCSLIAKTEAEAALGLAVSKITPSASVCQYDAATSNQTLRVAVVQLANSAAAAGRFNADLDELHKAGSAVEELQGIGDKAYFTAQPFNLTVLKGNFWLRLFDVPINVDMKRIVMLNLAAKALARLP